MSRRSGLQASTAAGVAVADGTRAAAGVSSSAPSMKKAGPGETISSCCPAGSWIGPEMHGRAGTGSPSSNAPTVVCTEVCTNRPASPITGP
jgi:hypothetical protein